MNKDEYVQKIKDKTGISKKEIEMIIDCFLDEVKTNLLEHEKVNLTNFGTFTVKTTKPHEFFSPVDGKKIKTTGIKKVYFSSSKALLSLLSVVK